MTPPIDDIKIPELSTFEPCLRATSSGLDECTAEVRGIEDAQKPIWRNNDHPRQRYRVGARTEGGSGKNIPMDGSSQLLHALIEHDLVDELHLTVYPLALGSGKRVLPEGVHTTFGLAPAVPYPTGVVGLHSSRQR